MAKSQTAQNPGVKVQKGKKPVGYDSTTTATSKSGDATKQSANTKSIVASTGNSG
jgi:hypothetical protein